MNTTEIGLFDLKPLLMFSKDFQRISILVNSANVFLSVLAVISGVTAYLISRGLNNNQSAQSLMAGQAIFDAVRRLRNIEFKYCYLRQSIKVYPQCWQESHLIICKTGLALFIASNHITDTLVACISLDRLVALKFPLIYSTHGTARLGKFIVVGFAVILTALTVPIGLRTSIMEGPRCFMDDLGWFGTVSGVIGFAPVVVVVLSTAFSVHHIFWLKSPNSASHIVVDISVTKGLVLFCAQFAVLKILFNIAYFAIVKITEYPGSISLFNLNKQEIYILIAHLAEGVSVFSSILTAPCYLAMAPMRRALKKASSPLLKIIGLSN